MSRWRQAFDRIGGPDAVTWPAFWVTSAVILVGNLAAGGVLALSVGERVLIVIASQVAMLVPLLLLRFTVLRNPPRPRPWIALGGSVVAGFTRGVALTSLLVATDAVIDPLWGYRIISSVSGCTILLLVVALTVGTTRSYRRSLERLIELQSQLDATRQQIVADVEGHDEEALARVQERLRSELLALEDVRDRESVEFLQHLASDVVRPMSHELAASIPYREPSAALIMSPRISWSQLGEGLVDRPPFRPILAAAYVALVLTQAEAGAFRGGGGLVMVVVATVSVLVLSWGANAALARILPHLRGVTVRLVMVAAAALVVGLVSAFAASRLLADSTNASLFIWSAAIYIALVVMLLALVTALLRCQRGAERRLEDSTETLRRGWSDCAK